MNTSICNKHTIKEYSLRNRLLKELWFNTYSEYLYSSLWRKNKNKFMKCNRLRKHLFRFGNVCEFCKLSWKMNVHHIRYFTIWKERSQDLYYICEDCHEHIHTHWFSVKTSTKWMQSTWRKARKKAEKFKDIDVATKPSKPWKRLLWYKIW